MAVRPNALRTLEYGKRMAEQQIERLRDMIILAQATLQTNKTLTAEEAAGYEECILIGKNHLKQFKKIVEAGLPDTDFSAKRGRGRPSEAELAQLAEARRNAKTAVAAPEPEEEDVPVKRAPHAAKAAAPATKSNKTPKAVQATAAAVVTPAKKKPGRKPKAETAPVAETVEAAPVKKRGRPKGSKNKPKVSEAVATDAATSAAPVGVVSHRAVPSEAEETRRVIRRQKAATQTPVAVVPAVNAAPMSDVVPVKRGPGRPKGSKNKPKVLNGDNTAAA